MAIAFGEAGTRLDKTPAGTTWDVAYPANIASGHILILIISTNGGAVTAPSSPWVTIYNETGLTNPKGGMFLKVADGSESGTLAVTTASTTGHARMFRYTGVDETTPQDAASTSVSNSTNSDPTIPAITTVTADTMLVYGSAHNSSSVTCTGPGGSTERVDFIGDGGSLKSGSLYDEPRAATGSTGTRTIDGSANRANWGAMLALRPAAAAETTDVIVAGI